jgi:hypothetical protein
MKNGLIAAVVMSTGLSAGAFAQGLTGAQATAAVYCCTAPVEPDRISNIATATVGAGVEFPLGSLGGGAVIPLAIDVAANTITLDYLSGAGPATGGAFNGYVFTFQGAPAIAGLSVNGASNFAPAGFSFTDDTIHVNVSGLNLNPSSLLVLDVMTAVPEAPTVAMLAAGLAVLGWRGARRRREDASGGLFSNV